MSGGHFNYHPYHIEQIAEILQRDVDESAYVREEFSLEAISFMKETLFLLKDVAARVHALDYLLAGDTSEEQLIEYYKRRKEESQACAISRS